MNIHLLEKCTLIFCLLFPFIDGGPIEFILDPLFEKHYPEAQDFCLQTIRHGTHMCL